MPIIIIVIVIIFVVVKCDSTNPTQNYYKKDVTNDEYKRVLEECENSKNRAIDWELYRNPKNYSDAGHLGEYAKDECFKEKGFVKGGSISDESTKIPPAPILATSATKTNDKKNVFFGSFRTEAETTKNKLECPNSVDSDITPASFEADGALYGCILGKAETVKWFINENPASKRVSSVKFLWNDWFKDMGYGLHSDKQEAKKALKVLIELYAPEKAKELNKLFLGNTNKTITSAKFTLKYTFDRGPAIDERMIIVTEAIHSSIAPRAETTPTSTIQDERVTKEDLDIRNDIAYLPNEDKPFTGRYETYYPNGNKKGVAHLKDGKYDGLMTLWDENGQNKSETYIKDGVEVPSKEYAEMTAAEKQQVQNDLNKMLKMASPEQIKKLADIVLPK